ncbi:hypothetical protein AWB78_02440 [Caballeronia calidae]|jgi:hypothetical protein|uniref:Uncharacterized protein n=1 Tax=Caballeronia calidae TaxID=1777139 RepID=A0A158BAD7_9BURK|nr:hypothetical protein [Caballeronia calidae]SAK66993.1 hypothetical protein AWB78_02440 [Caballeronia calidae]
MKPFALLSAAVLFVTLSTSTFADDAADCKAAGGSMLTGQVVSPPKFKSGMFRKGVELSHTHLNLKGSDNKTYDVAIDNVFASGYQKNKKGVPAPLNTIKVGDTLELCGAPFPGGIHWVHNNCGDTPTKSDPDGWIKKVSADGRVGENLELSQKYCYLWPHH